MPFLSFSNSDSSCVDVHSGSHALSSYLLTLFGLWYPVLGFLHLWMSSSLQLGSWFSLMHQPTFLKILLTCLSSDTTYQITALHGCSPHFAKVLVSDVKPPFHRDHFFLCLFGVPVLGFSSSLFLRCFPNSHLTSVCSSMRMPSSPSSDFDTLSQEAFLCEYFLL